MDLNCGDVDNNTESCGTDVRERLTLHVKKRLMVDPQDESNDGISNHTLNVVDVEQFRNRILKKSRKKKSIGFKHNKKKLKIKFEYVNLQESSGDMQCELDNEMETIPETNGESEETSVCDDINQYLMQPIPVSNVCGESFVNNSILNEILSEKKRALLESAEMIEFLQNRIRSS